MPKLAALALFLICLCGVGSAQAPSERIALVIGNGAYQRPAWILTNPPRDADLIAQRLRALGFQVDLVKDANRTTMESAFQRFGARLRAGGKTAEGVFYYAGHGAQQDGVNYLIPVDANARTADQVRFQAPAMQFLLDDMAAAGNAVNLIILDACRDMPLEQGFRSAGGGLADVGKLPNVFIAYAAAPGRIALDGDGANSPFTATLAKYLASEPNETVQQLFADVQNSVWTSTGGAQAPEYRNGLVRAPRWSFASVTSAFPRATTPKSIASVRQQPVSRSAAANVPTEFDDCGGAGWCPKMVVIPGGEFLMGSPVTEAGRERNEGPQHRVSVTSFATGKYEISAAQWDICVAERGCPNVGQGRGNDPETLVTWTDAKQYVAWLSMKTGKPYRLLSEAEWEFAARAGATTPYWWGATFDPSRGHALDEKNPRYANVGSFPPNPLGLFDMTGNAWEWVEDCYHETYDGAPSDGSAWTGTCHQRVLRGGSTTDKPQYQRSAFRFGIDETDAGIGDGFRIARSM